MHHILKFQCTHLAGELHIDWWLFGIVAQGICNTPVDFNGQLEGYRN